MKLLARRRLRDLVLDALFVAWLLSVLATGRVLPAQLTHLLRPEPPVAAVSEQIEPSQQEDVVPTQPET